MPLTVVKSYGMGRFLEIEEPETEHFELDFQTVRFNPPCSYSPAYDCPHPSGGKPTSR